MINKHVVVDGSNIATEGRTLPSLSQLDEAVRSFQDEFPAAEVTVVVDATFGHRIDDSEKPTFEEAVLAGELVSPPAGAIGRGDAFVLSIANKAEATVFSNDSFQEFHGQYTWLFDEGRLVGGKPVPGVGWVFVLRAPVRGPLSRRSTRDARVSTAKKAATKAPTSRTRAGLAETPRRRSRRAAAETAAVDTTGGAAVGAAVDVAPPVDEPPVDEPVVEATDTLAAADASAEGSGRGRRRRPTKQVEPINEPLPFLQFVSAHPVGSVVDGTVDRFSSHGAYVVIDSAQCYLPLRSMADPPPKSAKEVLNVGETRSFVVEAFESPRRSIDLAIPGFETVTAAPAAAEDDLVEHPPAEEAPTMASPKKAPTKKAAAKKTTAKKTASARKTTGAKAAAKKAATKKATAKKSAAKKTTPAKKTTGTKKATAKKTTATKTGKATARKATAKKATARKATAKKSTAKKAAATKKR